MNRQPISYLQTDARWKNEPYRVPGESSTIGSAGCGPSCAAMVIATLKDKNVTPKTCCDWSVAHGYKALNNGTYYAYFEPQFKAYGISCHQLPKGAYDEAMSLLKQGYYIIALMGKGLWTSGGHFVLVWWADDKIRINDPASTRTDRLNGDPTLFRQQAKYFWAISARDYNKNGNALPDKAADARIDTVQEVQSWLNSNYTAGLDLDGKYGKLTKKAIIVALQIESGFTGSDLDGIAGPKTLGAMPLLKKGSSGKFVKLLQCLLVCLGYSEAYVDGSYGNGTTGAVEAVQKKAGFSKKDQDGICGKQTWTKLIGA